MEVQTKKTLNVEFFQVEMPSNGDNSCPACDTVQAKLVSAIQEVQKLFGDLGCEILFKQTTIKTVDEAIRAKITSSPTIRVNHLNFYPEHLSPDEEAREWNWNGQSFAEPTKETLIEVLLKGYFEPEQHRDMQKISPYIRKYLEEGTLPGAGCGCK